MEFIGPGRIQSLNVAIPEAKSAQERREMWIESLTLLAKLHKIDYKKWVSGGNRFAELQVRLQFSIFRLSPILVACVFLLTGSVSKALERTLDITNGTFKTVCTIEQKDLGVQR